jgi:nucleotide-binding universal stress UspA family protein
MFRRVFVPLDGSRLAESALPAAVELAKHLGARTTLFHALERSAPATVHGERHLTAEAEAAAYLAEVASWMARRGITVDTHLDAQTDGHTI